MQGPRFELRRAQSRRFVVTVVSKASSGTRTMRPKKVSGYDKLKQVVVALVEGGGIIAGKEVMWWQILA